LADLADRFSWPVAIRTSDNIHRVWIGPFSSEQERLSAREAIGQAGFPTPVNAAAP
jgi:hypothetical protein